VYKKKVYTITDVIKRHRQQTSRGAATADPGAAALRAEFGDDSSRAATEW